MAIAQRLPDQETAQSRYERLAECRRRFRSAGLPLFDEDFSAATNVFNKAAPLLVAVFIVELLGAIKLEWSLAANLAAIFGGVAILFAATAALSRYRGRPVAALPEDVGKLELGFFVFVPALLPLVFGGQIRSAVVTAAINAALLLGIYAGFGYGLFSIIGWVCRRLWKQLLSSFMLLARAVPLLMIFALLAFMTNELWQVFATIELLNLAAVGVLFVGLGTSFLLARLSREVRALESEVGDPEAPLDPKQRRNVSLVLFTSQALQVLTVSLLVAAFFIVFGMIAVPEALRQDWIGSSCCQDPLLAIRIGGEEFVITDALVRVAAGLAAFTGFYFAIAMLTDSTYREEFLREVTAELRSVFSVRSEYLKLRSEMPADGSDSGRA